MYRQNIKYSLIRFIFLFNFFFIFNFWNLDIYSEEIIILFIFLLILINFLLIIKKFLLLFLMTYFNNISLRYLSILYKIILILEIELFTYLNQYLNLIIFKHNFFLLSNLNFKKIFYIYLINIKIFKKNCFFFKKMFIFKSNFLGNKLNYFKFFIFNNYCFLKI